MKISALTSIYIPYFYIEPFTSIFFSFDGKIVFALFIVYCNYRGAIFIGTIGAMIIYEGAIGKELGTRRRLFSF